MPNESKLAYGVAIVRLEPEGRVGSAKTNLPPKSVMPASVTMKKKSEKSIT